jgi:hypothetical protein
MPVERKKLTDKQERILVQSQLMGLTPRDMQQISNRMIALQKEAEEKADISKRTEGFSWEKINERDWKITTPTGYLLETTKGVRNKSGWDYYCYDFDFKVTKPGTRFRPRYLKNKSVRVALDWKKKLMPGESKELYAIIVWARFNNFDKDFL